VLGKAIIVIGGVGKWLWEMPQAFGLCRSNHQDWIMTTASCPSPSVPLNPACGDSTPAPKRTSSARLEAKNILGQLFHKTHNFIIHSKGTITPAKRGFGKKAV
jgi:hypothetical protein